MHPPTLSTKQLLSLLAEDLSYLEGHARKQPHHAHAAGVLRLGASLARNVVAPYLDGQAPPPLHVVVVGGAGAGKSMVANMLCGAVVAESNPQAGFTRHPIAYSAGTGVVPWASQLGFLGPLVRKNEAVPSNLDEDIYQVRRIPADNANGGLLRDWIVWDCPDMTTWAAEAYIPRLIETAALADVIVYVASDERYNDLAPTQFLEMVLRAGKPVVCCITKMREADAPAFIAHFRKAVLDAFPDNLGKGVIAVVPFPQMTPAQLADPVKLAGASRVTLANQVAVMGEPPATARRRTALAADRYLAAHKDAFTEAARADVNALEAWTTFVRAGKADFDTRYHREYLTSEKFRGFDEAMVQLMKLLELPGIGQIVSGTLSVLRLPYQWVRGLVGKALARPDAPTRPEDPILAESLDAWIDGLRAEVLRRQKEHELWVHLARGFAHGDLAGKIKEQFRRLKSEFQASLAQEVDRTARNIYERLEKNPVQLNVLRGGKLGLDAMAIGGAVVAGGIGFHDLLLVPLVASLTHQLAELVGQQVVDAEREAARTRQQTLLMEQLTGPLAEWLVKWPASGGSEFERLQQALRRLPESLAAVSAKIRETPTPTRTP